MEQLVINEVMIEKEDLTHLFECSRCKECINQCKILCISQEAVVYCKRFEKKG